MRIAVTGGLGFIGSSVAQTLVARGDEVIVIDNCERVGVRENVARRLKRVSGASWYKDDVRDTAVFEKLADAKIDAVVHTSANPGVPRSVADPVYDFRQNALATLNVLEFCRKVGAACVYLSTNKVYPCAVGEAGPLRRRVPPGRYVGYTPVHENVSLAGGRSPYGVSKLAGDLYAQEYAATYGVPTSINRMSCIYGPGQLGMEEQGWVSWFVAAKLLRKPLTIYGSGFQVRDLLYIDDLVRLFVWQLDNPDKQTGKVYNVGGGPENTASLLEVLEQLEYPMDQLEWADWRPADQKVYVSDIRKVWEATGWEPEIGIREGLSLLKDWVADNLDVWAKGG